MLPIMGWFTDTVINNTEVNTIEVRVIAGSMVLAAIVLLSYLCLRAHTKFAQGKMRQAAQHEIRLNNVATLQ